MAKSHVIQYFLEVENQYLEMLENLKEFQSMLNTNQISEDDYNEAKKEVEKLRTNYERIGYIIFLLNKPRKKSAKLTKEEQSWYNILKTSSKEAIVKECNDALVTFKKVMKKVMKKEQ